MAAFLTADEVIIKIKAGESLEQIILSGIDLGGTDLQKARFIGLTKIYH